MEKVRVLIVDDHTVVRQGLRMLLDIASDIEVVGEAADGREAIRLAHELQPEVVLMDLLMPVMDGRTATETIRQQMPKVEVIALTGMLDDSSVSSAIRAGAIGYLLKDSDADELHRAIKAAAQGQVHLSPEAADRLVKSVQIRHSPESLTERETTVLRLLARGHANKQIARELKIGAQTVKTHVGSILRKLQLQTRAAAALYAVDRGLVSAGDIGARKVRKALGEEAFGSAFEEGLRQTPETLPRPPLPVDSRQRMPAETAIVTSGARAPQRPVVPVLIVDRHRVVADGIQMLLEQHPDLQVVGIATNAGDAVALASETRPDVIVADNQLPDMTGAELAARLRDEQATTHVLLLSSVVSNALLREAVKAGARGFLLKTQPAEQLVDAVRRAGAGEMLIPATRLADFITGSDKDAQLFDLLTGREREVLRQLAAGLDNRHIAARMGIGYVTVRSHLRNLSSKLDAHSKVEILARAAELGLIVR